MNKQRAATYLKKFDFSPLFIEELGWNNPQSKALEAITVGAQDYALKPIAEKRGVQIFCCVSKGSTLPPYADRQKIERELTKRVFEHLIIYVDATNSTQIWQWVAREKGKPAAYREYAYHAHQEPDGILEKLEHIAFSLSDEEGLTLAGAVVRLKDAFDREKLTKKFYERFQKEHKAFLAFIKGLERETDRQWYASLMLNRLMFVYFIQKKGFLDGNLNYLRDRLDLVRAQEGKDKFHGFYRAFLLRLFHEGLAKPKSGRAKELQQLLGEIPYLNGGLFEPHELESDEHDIKIADDAFKGIFDFFDDFDWTLDTRPTSKADEINPDVLGHIFEKYVNQRQMGAYYTKEDITDYITQNTIIPWLFREAEHECPIAFEKGRYAWSLLQADPDRYIFKEVRHGADSELPEVISEGESDVGRRGDWNKHGSADLALATETWREVELRRERYSALKKALGAGQIDSIEALITNNLDIRQFARDVIQYAEGPEIVRAFWKAIQKISVLDPACGSGAFLFSALNILFDLYDACLDRMEEFVGHEVTNEGHRGVKFDDFRKTLEQIKLHPNRAYFIYKTIIVQNLYGVDIMDEAVEICKLRLFLKLAAQLETAKQIEPLPDIDFNIRAGNSLVGYSSLDDARQAVQGRKQGELLNNDAWTKIELAAASLDKKFVNFRHLQTELGGKVAISDKRALRETLRLLDDELNNYLAREFGVPFKGDHPKNAEALEIWIRDYKPFHWLIEFYGIMKDGGFNVVIGNPPYLETREIDYVPRGFETSESKAVHAMFIELSARILSAGGSFSMIVPLALVSTQRMKTAQAFIERGRTTWYSNFSWRPGKLFDTVNRALTIFVAISAQAPRVYSTSYMKWNSESRGQLIPLISFAEVAAPRSHFWVPKLGQPLEEGLLEKLLACKKNVGHFVGKRGSDNYIYYRTTGGLYWKVFTDFAPKFYLGDKEGHSSRETTLTVADKSHVLPLIAVLSSSLFWYWYTLTSNLRDLNPMDINSFPIADKMLDDPKLRRLGERYVSDLKANSKMLVRMQKQTGKTETQSFRIQKSKPIIDEIDAMLAGHYGLSIEELDFVINYDVKFRLGADEAEDDE